MHTPLTERDTQPVTRLRPVFVDPSGRRRRVVRRVAIGLSALVACYAVVLLAAAMGAPIPRSGFLPLPDAPTHQQPAPATGVPQAGGGGGEPSAGATRAGGPSATVGPKVSAPAGPPASQPPTSGVAVTPSVTTATTAQRPNSNANPAPPGLTKHTHPNGPTR
jgi:hypothetical protein